MIVLSASSILSNPALANPGEEPPTPQEHTKLVYRSTPTLMSSDTVKIANTDVEKGSLSGGSFISYTENFQYGENWPVYCDSFLEAPCDVVGQQKSRNEFGKPRIFGRVFLKPCESETDNFCIAELSARDDSKLVALDPIRSFSNPHWSMNGVLTDKQIGGDPKRGMPSGGVNGTIWQDSTTGSQFLTGGNMYFTVERGRVVPLQFGMEIEQVELISSTEYQPNEDPSISNSAFSDSWNGYSCLTTLTNVCVLSVKSNEVHRLRAKVRLPAPLQGWFVGRLGKPLLSGKKNPSNYQYTFEASQVDYQVLAGEFSKSNCGDFNCPDEFRLSQALPPAMPWPTNYVSGYYSGVGAPLYSPNDAEKALKALTSIANDTSTYSRRAWNVSLVEGWSSGCEAAGPGLMGMVTSNSMAHSGGPPVFKKKSFQYRVFGMHYLSDGKTPAQGRYDLLINSAVARCLYGFSRAPISAKISIINETGVKRVQVETVAERKGWLRIAVSGFGYSSPTIKVKLTQSKRRG